MSKWHKFLLVGYSVLSVAAVLLVVVNTVLGRCGLAFWDILLAAWFGYRLLKTDWLGPKLWPCSRCKGTGRSNWITSEDVEAPCFYCGGTGEEP